MAKKSLGRCRTLRSAILPRVTSRKRCGVARSGWRGALCFRQRKDKFMNPLLNLKTFLEGLQANAILIALVALIFFLILIIWLLAKYLYSILNKIDLLSKNLGLEIQNSVRPAFLEVSVSAEELIELAAEVWRFEQKFNKIVSQLPENYIKATKHSIEKFRRYLTKYDIQVIDFTGQKFNDGLNVDILNTEKDPSAEGSYVKETFEPAIMLRGTLVKRAKVIIVNN